MKRPVIDAPLLAADEPAPFDILHPRAMQPLLLVCDHASARMPRALANLGLDAAVLGSHLAQDMGAGAVTRQLAHRFRSTAVLGAYSRLVVDLNRNLRAPDLFLQASDGMRVPGNQALSEQDRQARIHVLYRPYHAALAAQLQRLAQRQPDLLLLSVHSFTPVFNGEARPWEVGILWDRDAATAHAVMDGFRRRGYAVGDNRPYSARALKGHTIVAHAEPAGVRHVLVELRQDLLREPTQLQRLASDLGDIIAPLLACKARPPDPG